MITNAATVGVYVSDQDRALDFYVGTLGFEKLRDEPMSPESRWIEVAPAGAQTRLVLFTPPGQEDRIGTFANVIFECDDMQATYEGLRGRGVEFSEEPVEQPWGPTSPKMWAQLGGSENGDRSGTDRVGAGQRPGAGQGLLPEHPRLRAEARGPLR